MILFASKSLGLAKTCNSYGFLERSDEIAELMDLGSVHNGRIHEFWLHLTQCKRNLTASWNITRDDLLKSIQNFLTDSPRSLKSDMVTEGC